MSDDPTTRPVTEAAVNAIVDKVGNLVSTLLDYSLGLAVNIIFLSRKAEEVAGDMERLQGLREDLKHEAEDEARTTQANVSNQLLWWMSKASSLATDASNFQKSFEDQSFCVTRFRLGFDAVELLRQMRRLTEEGKLFSRARLSRPRGPDPVEQVPSETPSSSLMGGKEALQRVESYIMDDGVGIIGIYGMGGVGKTSLLKIINNEFLHGAACRHKFEVAIWVTVSRDVQISTIQRTIADRLGLPSSSTPPKDELFCLLSKKRFILLLDDVWEKLSFEKVGIPHPKVLNNKSKIVFTTRTLEVCGEMDADEKVKIHLLDDKSSWDLFKSKFGRAAAVLDDPGIRRLATEIVERCGGLPIALITVGKAMSNARTTYDWKDATRKLDQCAAELSPGMEGVLKSLRFSFESLKNEALRSCLLYCALFPEDSKIPRGRIIDYWICEGFLDLEDFEEPDIEDTRCRGNALISELQNACLLEEVSDDFVMLHDTVRDMALWIAGHDFVVLAGSNYNASQVPQLRIWENARRISLIDNHKIEEPPSSSSCWNLSACPNLTTLLLQHSKLAENIPKGFFSFTAGMPTLRVLDLASTGLSEFPTEITSLISLQFLDLSYNKFTSLPTELGNLTSLRHLILRTTNLTSISKEAISRLSHLQVLDMEYTGYTFGDDTCLQQHPQLELSDLANLKRLSELYLPGYCSWTSLDVIAASPVLQRSTRHLLLKNSPMVGAVSPPPGDTLSERIGRLLRLEGLSLAGEPSDPVMGELQLYPSRLQNLQVIFISYFREAKISINISSLGSEPLFPRLRQLWIICCDGCSELTWVGRLPCLEHFHVADCKGLREVLLLDGGGHDHLLVMPIPFPKLRVMTLFYLPSLRSISTRPLLFPCLQQLSVSKCPRLRRLPFGPQSAKNLQSIAGQEAWWDGLDWDNHAHQQSLSSKFKALPDD